MPIRNKLLGYSSCSYLPTSSSLLSLLFPHQSVLHYYTVVKEIIYNIDQYDKQRTAQVECQPDSNGLLPFTRGGWEAAGPREVDEGKDHVDGVDVVQVLLRTSGDVVGGLIDNEDIVGK